MPPYHFMSYILAGISQRPLWTNKQVCVNSLIVEFLIINTCKLPHPSSFHPACHLAKDTWSSHMLHYLDIKIRWVWSCFCNFARMKYEEPSSLKHSLQFFSQTKNSITDSLMGLDMAGYIFPKVHTSSLLVTDWQIINTCMYTCLKATCYNSHRFHLSWGVTSCSKWTRFFTECIKCRNHSVTGWPIKTATPLHSLLIIL